jgi:hypothetical protein
VYVAIFIVLLISSERYKNRIKTLEYLSFEKKVLFQELFPENFLGKLQWHNRLIGISQLWKLLQEPLAIILI